MNRQFVITNHTIRTKFHHNWAY